MSRVAALFALVLVVLLGAATDARVAAASIQQVSPPVFSDEFNGPAGSQPDPARWGYDIGRYGANAGEMQYYTDRPANVSMDGRGDLRIVARPEPYHRALYTSGRIQTRNQFNPQYGRIEARIKVPAGRGLLPAFWLLGSDVDEGTPWPQSGEIDAMEIRGNDPSIYYGTVHGPEVGDPSNDIPEQRTQSAPARFSDGFHVYGIEWRQNVIQFLVDGVPVGSALTDSSYAALGGQWAFNKPFFLILNLAVGNGWTGRPTITTRWPAVMLVDWVRAYS